MGWRDAERTYTDEVIGETTIPWLFFSSVERNGDRDAQLYKGGVYDRSIGGDAVPEPPDGEYGSITFDEMGDIVEHLATGFRELGVGPDDRVGIYADTRMEWIHADLAIQTAEGVVTTVYTESAPSQVRYLLDDNDAMGCVVGTEALLETLLEVADDLDLEFVVTLDDVDEAYAHRENVYTLADVLALGEEAHDDAALRSWLASREWTDLSSLVYTSGTTGDPKGVRLTHRNWRSCLNQIRKRIGPRPDKPDDVPVLEAGKTGLAFLPLAHAFERANHYQMLGSGLTVAYAGSPDTIADDIQLVEPEFAAAVPRVYERIYDGIREQASESSIKKRIFEWSVDVAQAYDRAEQPSLLLRAKHAAADRLVYSTVRDALGGNIEMFISGGGSLSADLARLYSAMGITIVEGYGLTETAPGVTFNPPEAIRVGTMGPPLCDVDVRLDADVVDEETKAAADGEVGELLVAGPNVFDGYWHKPDKTDAAFTGDGYFRTGDIVAEADDGYVSFVDRLKNLIVLDTGKNVAPEPIEDAFSTSARVDQIMVVGDDQKFVGALIRPNIEELREWADDEDVDLSIDPAEAIEDDRVHDWIAEEVDRVNESLGHHETVKAFRLVAEEWTADNDLLTPSMKKKRRNIRDAYAAEIADIYDESDDFDATTDEEPAVETEAEEEVEAVEESEADEVVEPAADAAPVTDASETDGAAAETDGAAAETDGAAAETDGAAAETESDGGVGTDTGSETDAMDSGGDPDSDSERQVTD